MMQFSVLSVVFREDRGVLPTHQHPDILVSLSGHGTKDKNSLFWQSVEKSAVIVNETFTLILNFIKDGFISRDSVFSVTGSSVCVGSEYRSR